MINIALLSSVYTYITGDGFIRENQYTIKIKFLYHTQTVLTSHFFKDISDNQILSVYRNQ